MTSASISRQEFVNPVGARHATEIAFDLDRIAPVDVAVVLEGSDIAIDRVFRMIVTAGADAAIGAEQRHIGKAEERRHRQRHVDASRRRAGDRHMLLAEDLGRADRIAEEVDRLAEHRRNARIDRRRRHQRDLRKIAVFARLFQGLHGRRHVLELGMEVRHDAVAQQRPQRGAGREQHDAVANLLEPRQAFVERGPRPDDNG